MNVSFVHCTLFFFTLYALYCFAFTSFGQTIYKLPNDQYDREREKKKNEWRIIIMDVICITSKTEKKNILLTQQLCR